MHLLGVFICNARVVARLSRRLGNLTCPKEKAVVVGPHTTISTHHDTSTGVCTHLGMQKQFLSVDDLAGRRACTNCKMVFSRENPLIRKKNLGVSEVKTRFLLRTVPGT